LLDCGRVEPKTCPLVRELEEEEMTRKLECTTQCLSVERSNIVA